MIKPTEGKPAGKHRDSQWPSITKKPLNQKPKTPKSDTFPNVEKGCLFLLTPRVIADVTDPDLIQKILDHIEAQPPPVNIATARQP